VLSLARRCMVVIVVAASAPACDDPCWAGDDACSDGFRCFEGSCHAVCDDDATCLEGETCHVGVCLDVAQPTCAFAEVP
jgi:hypothetical protein